MRRGVGCLVLGLFVAAAFAVSERPACAADDVDALVKKGVELRRQGKEREALEVFRRAAEIKKTPRVVAQVAFAEQALGQWAKAETHLKEALEGKSDPWIVKNRAVIVAALNNIATHLGSLEVWGTPAGAEILVDGEPMGTLPSSGELRLPLGEVSVRVRHPGFAEATRVVLIARSGLVRENIDLHSLPPPTLVATDPQAATGGPSGSGGTAVVVARKDLDEGREAPDSGGGGAGQRRPVYKRWWFWTLIGVAAVGAGAGAFVLTHRGTTGFTCDPGVACGTWGATPAGATSAMTGN